MGEVAVKLKAGKVRRLKGETEEEHRARAKAQASKKLASRGKGPFTMLHKSFRGHVSLHSSMTDYLALHVRSLLQDRHKQILRGERNSLASSLNKLILNIFFGYGLMECTRIRSGWRLWSDGQDKKTLYQGGQGRESVDD